MKMPQKIKTVLKILDRIIMAVLILAACLVAWLTVNEFDPETVETVPVSIQGENKEIKPVLKEKIRVLTFNIGYGNLGKESDFFMDGGKNVRNGDKELVLKNLGGIIDTLYNADADIYFIQEADIKSKRSFKINEMHSIEVSLGGRTSFAKNYSCDFVPFPLPPIGAVESGIMTNTEFYIETGERISLPCPFRWPVSAANLKRCLLINRCEIEGSDKELVMINLHLEAYDSGEGKIAQTKMLWDILESEYAKGNYVIAGGDFNQSFPGAEEKYPIFTAELWEPGVLEESDLPEGWQYVYDSSVPTCRLLDKPYDEKTSQHYVIDGFIISPNVELLYAETLDCGFEFSDHNPVLMEVVLK